MKFTAVLFALAAAATASAAAVSERELTRDEVVALRATYSGGGDESLDARSLEPRGCKKSSCDCVGIKAGLFCGDGNLGCKKGNVYQCSGGSRSCLYGKRNSCVKCNKLNC